MCRRVAVAQFPAGLVSACSESTQTPKDGAAPTDAGTDVAFTHVGLTPDGECFDSCSNAWGFYISGSLRNLIESGQGEPNQRETATER